MSSTKTGSDLSVSTRNHNTRYNTNHKNTHYTIQYKCEYTKVTKQYKTQEYASITPNIIQNAKADIYVVCNHNIENTEAER